MKKTMILVAMTVTLAAASGGAAFARNHDRGTSARPAQSTTTDGSMTYANRYRAPVGANPYTHDLPSTDGSDR
jgi:hypothetical protein